IRRLAVAVLAQGFDRLRYLREEAYLGIGKQELFQDRSRTSGQPIVPEPPRGLKAEMVRPLLDDPDPATAAGAGYLLALLGEERGLEPLLRYWREEVQTDESWRRLVYRALAALGDDRKVPLLEEIFHRFGKDDSSQVSEFYWTIRVLEGPNALRLRKEIRQKIGMDKLR